MKKDKSTQCKRSQIGGQALLEGVMMKSPRGMAMVVRKENGRLASSYKEQIPWSKRNKFFGLPIVRGCVSFVESLTMGMETINYAASMLDLEEEEPSRFELWLSKKLGKGIDQIVIGVAVVIAVLLSVGLFFALPSIISSLISPLIGNIFVTNIVEGLVRMLIFLGYLVAVSKVKDIKRMFMYHGAEHKTIACYESGAELTVENAAKCTRFHARCGTNYMFLVMMVSILFFSLVGFDGHWAIKLAIRLACLPIVAGLSYEVLKAAARGDGIISRIVRWPGVQLQKVTTGEPDESMLEVAILAFNMALEPEKYPATQAEDDVEDEIIEVLESV